MTDLELTKLLKRLDLYLSLKLNPMVDSPTDQEKIERLDLFGFSPSEIATILGSTSEKISKQLYVIRSKKKK